MSSVAGHKEVKKKKKNQVVKLSVVFSLFMSYRQLHNKYMTGDASSSVFFPLNHQASVFFAQSLGFWVFSIFLWIRQISGFSLNRQVSGFFFRSTVRILLLFFRSIIRFLFFLVNRQVSVGFFFAYSLRLSFFAQSLGLLFSLNRQISVFFSIVRFLVFSQSLGFWCVFAQWLRFCIAFGQSLGFCFLV